MPRKKKDEQKLKLACCTRYTYEAWMKCYPNSNYEEWKEITKPNSLMDFYYGLLDAMEVEEPEFDVKVVTLDDEYFSWLGNKENTEANRAKYAETTSEEDATRLMKKNRMDKIAGLYFVPAIFFPQSKSDTVSLKVTRKLREKIKNGIERTVNASVYVPGVVISSQNLSGYTEDDYECIYENVMAEKKDAHEFFGLRKTPDIGTASVDFMPIKVTHSADSCIIRPDDYAQPEKRGFSIFSSCWDIFSKTEISEKNKDGIVVIDPIVYDTDELPQAYEEITGTLENLLEQMSYDPEDIETQGYA